MHDINVYVFKMTGRSSLQLQYRDPITGKLKTRSAGTSKRSEAEKAAGKWQSELREGRFIAPSKVLWADFRERYEAEVMATLALKTFNNCTTSFNTLERLINPEKLRDVTATQFSTMHQKLRDEGLSEATISCYARHIRAALNWGVTVGLLPVAPKLPKLKRPKGKVMKGRPITLEEFERLTAKVEAVVGAIAAPSWKRLLEGLWLSGLRLGEALELWWDRDDRLSVDLAGRRPKLRIHATLEKGKQDRELPMAPEFAEFLLKTPESERTGLVFKVLWKRGRQQQPSVMTASVRISAIGERAGVKVNTNPTTGKVKFASAHDLRRSFGARWAPRVMPQVLMQLMRHESIETTLRYYVGRDADATADVLWEAHRKLIPSAAPNTDAQTASVSGED